MPILSIKQQNKEDQSDAWETIFGIVFAYRDIVFKSFENIFCKKANTGTMTISMANIVISYSHTSN